MRLGALAIAVIVLGGCGEGEPVRGSERAACYANGTCSNGLLCLSDRCVRPPQADCREVAQALTSIELGNYATLEERAPRVHALEKLCRDEHVTKKEGECILAAGTRGGLEWCPKPLIAQRRSISSDGPTWTGGSNSPAPTAKRDICTTYVQTLERFAACSKLPSESARALRDSIAQLKTMYAQYASTGPQSMFDSCKMANEATQKAMQQLGC